MNDDLQDNNLQSNDLQNNDTQLDFLIKNMAKDHQPELPSPGLIWWRAQIQRKLADRERAEKPMVIMRAAAVAVMLAIVAGIVVANWHEVTEFMSSGRMGPSFILGILAAGMLLFAGSSLLREAAGKS